MWWLKLQPGWRQVTTKDQLEPIKVFKDDWQTLDKFSNNGWVCLLVSLKWWGAALLHHSVGEQEHLEVDLFTAIRDVYVGLDRLAHHRVDNVKLFCMQL